MTKQTIEVEGLPEGYEVNTISVNAKENISQCFNTVQATIHLRKIQPRRIVLEETEEFRFASTREWIQVENGMIGQWEGPKPSTNAYKIWREVKETDIPLTNSESKLSLSVDECRSIIFAPIDLHVKLEKFIKENS